LSANEWRRERGYELLPEFGTYTDHMSSIVLLAINTGLRRGELLQLNWGDVDLERAILTVRGECAKSGKTRHVPLNTEAVRVLREWRPVDRRGLVFPSEDGEQMNDLKTAWLRIAKLAKLRAFRFHDLRHHVRIEARSTRRRPQHRARTARRFGLQPDASLRSPCRREQGGCGGQVDGGACRACGAGATHRSSELGMIRLRPIQSLPVQTVWSRVVTRRRDSHASRSETRYRTDRPIRK